MTSASKQPSDIPSGKPDDGRQLGALLDAARDMLAEEIRRTDRLETRARHMSTACGALFAVAMGTTGGVLNALLRANNGNLDDWVVPMVAGLAFASLIFTGAVIGWTLGVQRLRETNALDPKTIEDYITWAEKGHVAVGKNLIKTYAILLRSRRRENDKRARDLDHSATPACVLSLLASLAQFVAVFIALLLSR